MRHQATPQVKIYPPLFMGITWATGFFLYLSVPQMIPCTPWMMGLGLACAVAAFTLIVSSFRVFRANQTPFDVRKPVTHLITQGVYRWSRNPLYLAEVLSMAACGLLLPNVCFLLIAFSSVLMIQEWIIKPEEAYLSDLFGEKYRQYKIRVRRWI